MMTLKKKILIPTMIGLTLILSTNLYAGDPPPVGGDPTGDPGNAIGAGGSAPIGSGLALVLGLGLAYGARKTFQLKSEEE